MKPALVLLCLPIAAFAAEEKPALDPGQAYSPRKSDPVTYEIDFAAVVTAPYHTKVLKVWMPLPPTDAVQEVEEGPVSTFPMKVTTRIGTEKKYGKRFAYFDFDHMVGETIILRRF